MLVSLVSWWLLINYFERTYVKHTIQKCEWSKWEDWKSPAHRVSLFADPQIMDDHSYPGRPAIVNFFARKLIDNYHKRNWEYVNYVLDSDTTIFLGDLFDGGRNWNDSYWFDEFKRFNSIYHKIPHKRIIMSLPGNHDIGFGETVEVEALDRFRAFFGETSSIHAIGNHSVVLLDTISLSDFSNEAVTLPAKKIMESLAPLDPRDPPRILLTHVPLYRNPTTQQCGPLRESLQKFPIMKGEQYQTVIENGLTQEILSKIRPKIVFSGDDHDYCHIEHTYGASNTAEEITVKSCSMNMGIKYPAIQLLSLNTQDGGPKTYQTNICYLPDPYFTLKSYLVGVLLNVLMLLIIFLTPKQWNSFVRLFNRLLPRQPLGLPIAEKVKVVRFEITTRDWVGLITNGTLIATGVLVIVSLYFNAF